MTEAELRENLKQAVSFQQRQRLLKDLWKLQQQCDGATAADAHASRGSVEAKQPQQSTARKEAEAVLA